MKFMRSVSFILSVSLLSSSCVGNFKLFNKLAAWNVKQFENKWLAELVYLGLSFIPVYGICFLADALVFNSIEFWTGKNPIEGVKIETTGNFKFENKGDGVVSINNAKIGNFEARILDNSTVEFSDLNGKKIVVQKMENKYKIISNGVTQYYRPNLDNTFASAM